MKGITVVAAAMLLVAVGVGCQRVVVSETYRPLGPSFQTVGAAPMSLRPADPTMSTPGAAVRKRAKAPWYKFEWLFGRRKTNRPPSALTITPPKGPPAPTITMPKD